MDTSTCLIHVDWSRVEIKEVALLYQKRFPKLKEWGQRIRRQMWVVVLALLLAGCTPGYAERFHRGMTAQPYNLGKPPAVQHCAVVGGNVVCH